MQVEQHEFRSNSALDDILHALEILVSIDLIKMVHPLLDFVILEEVQICTKNL